MEPDGSYLRMDTFQSVKYSPGLEKTLKERLNATTWEIKVMGLN